MYECIKVGCSRDDAIECMQKKTPDVLTEKQWEVKQVTSSAFFFVPTIDDQFLKKSPLDLLKSGEFQKKNILLGMNNHEGSYFVIYSFKEQFNPEAAYNANITNDEYRETVSYTHLTLPTIYSV